MLNYKKILLDANKIIKDNFDFLEEMEVKRAWERDFRKEEAEAMCKILTDLYVIIHTVRCKACGEKYRL